MIDSELLECELKPGLDFTSVTIDVGVKDNKSRKTHQCGNPDKSFCQLK
jgi:hypothetical protein